MASLLNIGITGLRVNQTALQVTGNNIANADVESYSRQVTEFVTGVELFSGGGFIGTGSNVDAIQRIADQFVSAQILLDTSNFESLAAFGSNIEQLDSLLAGDLSSLGPSIAKVFTALEVAAEDPTSGPARQLVLSEAESFIESIHTLYGRIEQQAASVDEQMTSLTARVSSLAVGIAELNESISRELAINAGAQPNALLDARDELLRQLTEVISIQTTEDSGGSVNVFVGNGQPLVVGSIANSMGTQPSVVDPQISDITFISSNGTSLIITDSVSGGEIGGLVRFRTEVLEPTLNSLGRISLSITDSLNQQNKQGIDLEGNFGSLIFTDINTSASMADRSTTLSGTATLNVLVDDLPNLSVDNYILRVTGVGVPITAQLTNQTTGEVIAGTFVDTDHDNNAATADVSLFTPTDPTKTEGVKIFINSGALALNDEFSIRPTRDAARDIGMQMTRTQELAFSAPVVTGADLANTGGGTVSPGTVLEAFDRFDNASPAFTTAGQLSPPISITFTSPTAYDVFDSSTVPQTFLFAGVFVKGQSNDIFSTNPAAGAPTYTGYQIALAGNPATGDTFTVDYNSGGISDNRNAVALGALRTTGIVEGGTLDFEDDYGRLVEQIGSETAQNRVSQESSFSLLQASINSRSQSSGVNLDEEAANLIRFEQAYNASAQVISVARQIFETMLNAFR